MIHWGWMVAAFCAGMLAGVFIIALCSAAGTADDRMEQLTRKTTEEEITC
jgi:hypothetical protein